MLQEIDKLVKDLTPTFTILAPLITVLAAFITVKMKAPGSQKREPTHIQKRQVRKKS